MEKNPGDLVTVADREAEELITARLTAAYPDAVVLGEEAFAADHALMDRYLAAEHAFTVDPVDGTKNFVNGSPDHAVMVAETVGGETVRGWIWQPEHEVAWVAERGAGTWRDGVQVHTAPVPDDREPQGVTSMWSMRDQRLGDLPAMRLSWVCCGVDYPRLIEGAADYIVYSRSNPWDHAPGTLIVTEAGGSVVPPRRRRPTGRARCAPGWSWPSTGRRVPWCSAGWHPSSPAEPPSVWCPWPRHLGCHFGAVPPGYGAELVAITTAAAT